MLARVLTYALSGLDMRTVSVEVDVRPGLPSLAVVGLGDAAVREARERVRAAVVNSGFQFPPRRVVVNLAPAHLRKGGSGFDVAIACGVLAASGQVPPERLERLAVFGELSLSGELRGCRGALAVAEAARRAGLEGLVVPPEAVAEAALVDGLRVIGLARLADVAELLRTGTAPEPAPVASDRGPRRGRAEHPDLCDVRGHRAPIEALRIAAAGGHNVLLSGAPGTGKTMLARRIPSILPPLTRPEAIEVTRIHSVAGVHHGSGLVAERPFRSPHHTISPAGLVGGGPGPSPGEATLAHHGVLLLDELSEFARSALEALRQPLEDGRVAIVRGQHTAVFPSRFMLVATTNPCPCGYASEPDRCRCTEADVARHARRLSGPLLDRIDIRVDVHRPAPGALAAAPDADSASVRAQVVEARERQQARLAGTGAACNADMDAALVARFARPDDAGRAVLETAYAHARLSARGHQRVLRLARTVADLAGRDRIAVEDVHVALLARQGEPRETVAA